MKDWLLEYMIETKFDYIYIYIYIKLKGTIIVNHAWQKGINYY